MQRNKDTMALLEVGYKTGLQSLAYLYSDQAGAQAQSHAFW